MSINPYSNSSRNWDSVSGPTPLPTRPGNDVAPVPSYLLNNSTPQPGNGVLNNSLPDIYFSTSGPFAGLPCIDGWHYIMIDPRDHELIGIAPAGQPLGSGLPSSAAGTGGEASGNTGGNGVPRLGD